MYPRTADYIEQIEYARRNPSHIKIVFGLTDPDAPGASTFSDNGHLYYSNMDSIDVGYTVPKPYVTLEPGRWLLNGKGSIPKESNFDYQGYNSTEMSGADCTFSTSPVLTIEFREAVFFPGLGFQFDDVYEEYPTAMQLVFSLNGAVVLVQMLEPDSTNFSWSYSLPVHDKLVITFLSTNKPYRRVRLFSLVYGLIKTFTEEGLISSSGTRNIDPISSKLPSTNMSFTVFDTKQEYNPENPQGVWEYLDSGQSVKMLLGYELDGGDVEWMPWCSNFSTGDISVSSTGSATKLTITTTSLLSFLTQKYTQGKYVAGGVTLASLVQDLMTFAGMPNAYTVDSSLNTLTTDVPLPADSVCNLLQLIANAAMCVLNVDRGGQVSIEKEHAPTDGFDLTLHKQFTTPVATKYPALRDLKVAYSTVTDVSGTAEVLVNAFTLVQATSTTVEISYSMSRGQTYTSSGITVESIQFYAYGCSLTYSGTGTINVSGVAVEIVTASLTMRYAEIGSDSSMSNVLVNSSTWATAYNTWVAGYYTRRVQFSSTNRGYPEIDPLDSIALSASYNNAVGVTVVETGVSFNGAIRGTAVLLASTT